MAFPACTHTSQYLVNRIPRSGRVFKRLFSNSGLVISTSSSVLSKVKEIDRKIDELREFLEDIFLTPEEYRLLREVDSIIRERKLSELTPLDEVQGSTSQKS